MKFKIHIFIWKKKLYTSKVYLMHGQIKNVQTRRSKNDKK